MFTTCWLWNEINRYQVPVREFDKKLSRHCANIEMFVHEPLSARPNPSYSSHIGCAGLYPGKKKIQYVRTVNTKS